MEGTFPVAVGVGIVTDDPGSLLDEYGEKLCHNAECQGQVEPKGCSYMGSACFLRPTHFMPLGLPEPEEGR